jgi:hypothetical protein
MSRTKTAVPSPWTLWPRPGVRLPQEALTDLLCSYDPRFDETVTLVGIHLRGTRQRVLRFLARDRIEDVRHALEFAFVAFGGLPSRVELPWIHPFTLGDLRSKGDGTWSDIRIDRLSRILGTPAFLPDCRNPSSPAARSLELLLTRVLDEFVPLRPRETLGARNLALFTWVQQRGWDLRSPGAAIQDGA